jgi:hypothetical protein
MACSSRSHRRPDVGRSGIAEARAPPGEPLGRSCGPSMRQACTMSSVALVLRKDFRPARNHIAASSRWTGGNADQLISDICSRRASIGSKRDTGLARHDFCLESVRSGLQAAARIRTLDLPPAWTKFRNKLRRDIFRRIAESSWKIRLGPGSDDIVLAHALMPVLIAAAHMLEPVSRRVGQCRPGGLHDSKARHIAPVQAP